MLAKFASAKLSMSVMQMILNAQACVVCVLNSAPKSKLTHACAAQGALSVARQLAALVVTE